MTDVLEVDELRTLDQQLAAGYTLPASWYRDPSIHELERERIFARSWQYAGPADWVSSPGDHFPCKAGHVPLVVARGEDGELRAFVNVCRHRAHIVVHERGRRGTLQCPYHAWTYNLDGSLRAAPRCEEEPDFDLSSLPLLGARAETWGPFVFVNPDPYAPPLAEILGDLPSAVAAANLDLAEVRFRERVQWKPMPVNWKVAIENDLECYHCAVAHPGYSDLIDVRQGAYGLDVQPTFTTQIGPVRDEVARGDRAAPYDISGDIGRAQAHLLWPNLGLYIDPGRPNISVALWRPTAADRVEVVADYYFAPDAPEEFVTGLIGFQTQTGSEDVALVAGVQEGLSSGMVAQGRLLGRSERLIAAFQRWVYEALSPQV